MCARFEQMVKYCLSKTLSIIDGVTVKGCFIFLYSDEEAVKLILKEPSRRNSKEQWKETQSGSIL